MIGFLLKNQYVLLTGGLLIISAFGGYSLWVYHKGKKDCQNDYQNAIIKAEREANLKIEIIREESEKRIKEIENAPYHKDESIISPVLWDTLDGLHKRHSKTE